MDTKSDYRLRIIEHPLTRLTSSFRYDTRPSLLECPIPASTVDKHSAKRPKLSPQAESTTIAAEIKSQSYQNVEELLHDVDIAVSTISNKEQVNDGHITGSYPINGINGHNQESLHISAFRKELSSILRREVIQKPRSLGILGADAPPSSEDDQGQKDDTAKALSSASADSNGRTVLTLLSSASQPRQLFSSLQEAKTVNPSKASQVSESDIPVEDAEILGGSSILNFPTLRETALPNGISTTKVIPIHSTSVKKDKTKSSTIGDIFTAGSNIKPLSPPEPSKHTVTRSQHVEWFNPSEASTPARRSGRGTFTTQPLTTGQWLTYNIAPSPKQLSTPEAKRKQRDRALSQGESKTTLPREEMEARYQAREEALFRSAYSSFAPDHDNTAALVPEKLKNRLWWKRFSQKRLQDIWAQSDMIPHDDSVPGVDDFQSPLETSEDALFKEAVENWTPEDIPSEFKISTKEAKAEQEAEKDVQDILKEISELLETLSSHQHVRNLSLHTNARKSVSQNLPLTAMSGSPSGPSSTEVEIYNVLKSQLSLMISALPPYAVAKLNGEQLEALSISTRIPTEARNYHGTMEDVESATKIRAAIVPTTVGSSMRTMTPTASTSARSSHYQQSLVNATPRATYPSQTAVRATAPPATYPSQPYSARPSSSATQYTTHASYPTVSQQAPPSSNRHSYPTPQYNYQTSQAHHGQYTNGHRPQPNPNGYSSYSQQYAVSQQATSPAPIQGSQHQRPSQPGYQQRAQNTQPPSYALVPSGRSASPQNSSAGYNAYHHRTSFSAPSLPPGQSQPRPPYNPQSSQIANANNGAIQLNNAVGTVGQHINLTAAEQAMLMDRQKQQLAQQIRMTTARQGSGTPQPTPGPSGPAPAQLSNGMSASQLNGVTPEHGQ